VPVDSVVKLVHKLQHQRGIKIDMATIPEADHFFTGQLDPLKAAIEAYLDHALVAPPPATAAPARAVAHAR
jgi:alpha/beta superfamily hydrolase